MLVQTAAYGCDVPLDRFMGSRRQPYGQRLRDAGVSEEDRALLLGHAIEGMPRHYATATVARPVEVANKVAQTVDRTTLLRVVNG